jgi:magnesium transporter
MDSSSLNPSGSPITILNSVDHKRIDALRSSDDFFWLDLVAPSAADIETLGEIFGFHELALEDTQNFGQRPKFDDYGDYAFAVFFGARPGATDAEPELTEVHVFVHGGFLVTVRHDHCVELDGIHDRLLQVDRGSETFFVYRVLDALTDSFFPILAKLDDQIDVLEDEIIQGARQEQLQRVFVLKRTLVSLRKVVTPQRDMLARMTDRMLDIPGLENGSHDYFRDVYDHMIRISDMIDAYRDLLSGSIELYMSTVANRQNEEMKKLTLMATIFLPLTFLTGFFGQNFRWMVDNIATRNAFLMYGIGTSLVTIIVLMVYFRRRQYW